MKLRLLCTESTKGSQSLKTLAQTLTSRLGYKVWRSTREKPRRLHLKYGHSVDKLTQYRWFQERGLSSLEFTTRHEDADTWIEQGETVFGRKYLNSSCGKGIVVFEAGNGISPMTSPCPVYTKYKKKKREFRVHIFKDRVVMVCEKLRKKEFNGESDTKIRNLANGYVFVQNVANEPAGLRELALAAAAVSPSDFKGVDIGYNEKKEELFIIEVNSAPGIQGSNVNRYAEVITNA